MISKSAPFRRVASLPELPAKSVTRFGGKIGKPSQKQRDSSVLLVDFLDLFYPKCLKMFVKDSKKESGNFGVAVLMIILFIFIPFSRAGARSFQVIPATNGTAVVLLFLNASHQQLASINYHRTIANQPTFSENKAQRREEQ